MMRSPPRARSPSPPVVGALALLVVRQIAERRLLRWNMACALSVIALGAALLLHSTRPLETRKPYPSTYIGRSKSVTATEKAKPTRIEFGVGSNDAGPIRQIADRGAGAETVVIYCCEAFALVAVARGPRRPAALLLFGTTVLGLTMIGLVVSSVATIYRFRYLFWILLAILGATGVEKVVAWRRAR